MREDAQSQFVMLYLNSQHSIRQILRLLLRDHRLLDDACQAVAMRLWELFETYDPLRPFDVWARGVAAKVVLELQRGERRAPFPVAEEAAQALLEGFQRHRVSSVPPSRQLDALEACLEILPSSTRQLVLKRYEQALPVDEVAIQMNRTVEATYKALQRTLRQLGDCVRTRMSVDPPEVRGARL
ncbi:sigma-70 family RNA polymerase sigma factor [Planctomicrobium sp. SH664]|uniref:sigma-70 family RNA polymerase sigma factor n=1 Tax=Planctomicrobium sp. SH664 TaxID=3448125 RepID=UPI003F5C8DE3